MTILQGIAPILEKERDLEQLQHMLNMEEQNHRIESSDDNYRKSFKLMNHRDDTTTFLPLDSRIGGQNKKSLTVGQYLTREQTRNIYKKV